MLPDRYRQWNDRWGAPFGRSVSAMGRRLTPRQLLDRRVGPFAFQPNNSTRAWEYPWAFHAVPIERDTLVVDVGGALSGLQFTLDRAGAAVINVDPFVDYGTSGEYAGTDPGDRLRSLNRSFRTAVELRRTTLVQAALGSQSVTSIYCISTIEHLSEAALVETLGEIRRVLRPGGHAVVTVDLFLDLAPFTAVRSNRWGTNVDVRDLVDASGLELAGGEPGELLGFDEFDAGTVRSHLDDYLVGTYPGLAQCLVLRKA